MREQSMQRTIVRPDKLDLDSPGRRDYSARPRARLSLGRLPHPAYRVCRARARANEGLVSFGSNHGNEYEGPIVLKHLVRDINIDDVIGRIILVPVLNPAAFRRHAGKYARRRREPQSGLR